MDSCGIDPLFKATSIRPCMNLHWHFELITLVLKLYPINAGTISGTLQVEIADTFRQIL